MKNFIFNSDLFANKIMNFLINKYSKFHKIYINNRRRDKFFYQIQNKLFCILLYKSLQPFFSPIYPRK